MGPEVPVPDWLVALWRYHKQKAEQAKDTMIRLEREIAQIQKEQDEIQAEIEKEEKKRARDEYKPVFD